MKRFSGFLYIFLSVIIVFVIIKVLVFSGEKKTSDDQYRAGFNRYYKIFSVEVPENIDFAGEKIQTNRYDIRESIERELLTNTFWQSQTLMLIKRANRWFPVIVPILKKNGIPEDFKYLSLAESGLTNNSVSPAGATGIWQFLKGTAEQYGLIVNDEIDERYHIEKSTEAACKYLKDSYKKLNNWSMVAASYNMGISAVQKQSELQKSNNYYDLHLNNETARYLYRIIAIKIILSNPGNYGFYLRKKDLYPFIPTYTVIVDSSISDIPGFAKKYGINYKILKEYNLWIRKPSFKNDTKARFAITIPVSKYLYYDTLLLNIQEEPFIINDSSK